MLLVIFIFFMLLSLFVSWQLKRRFAKYSQIALGRGLSGREIAEKMLSDHGIRNVSIVVGEGALTDHYNPATMTVSLSPDVYHGRHISAASVAAHECGHAIQHAQSYAFLQLRSMLVPVQNVSAKVLNIIFIALFVGAIFLPRLMPFELALPIIIACYGVLTAFAFITLPVEIDASRRALVWLSNSGLTTYDNHGYAKDALKWAAYTYVVAALSSLATLLYYIWMYTSSRD